VVICSYFLTVLIQYHIISHFELKQDQITPLSTLPIGYGSILKRIVERGKLFCGVRKNLNLRGFAYLDEKGHYEGFDVALCRAVAVAVLNDPEAIEFVPLVSIQRWEALRSGQVDMLSHATTWTTSREIQWGDFTWIMFYDGQGFMVKENSGITHFEQLNGESVCVTEGTTTELHLKNAFTQRGLAVMPMVMENTQAAYEAYQNGECTAFSNDKSQLAEARYSSNNPDEHLILEITVSKEPLTPIVPYGDSQWVDIVKTVMFGLINAEELKITQANVDKMMNSIDPEVKRLLGTEGTFGQHELGLKADAIAQVIKAVGNYGEIYERYLGVDGIGIPRGLNRLWTEGGLMYAPSLR
jgi:general L-amino acid transport system substrate-binding protein